MCNFKQTIWHDWSTSDPDINVVGLGHSQQRHKIRKKQTRRARRVLKQQLKNELAS